jgi:IclR family KDG regulon transcriptional repressor
MSNPSVSRAATRALAVLEYLARSDGPQPLAQISEALGLNKATTHRMLQSLIETGYVYRDAQPGMYRPGFKICELSSCILERMDLKYIVRPHLEELARQTGETVHLVIRDWSHGVYIDKIESTHAIRMRSIVGGRVYLHSTAPGKVLLATLPWTRVEQIIAGVGLPRRTAHTITDAEELRRELGRVAQQGWGSDREEDEEGVQCLAAPLRNYRKQVVAAVSIAIPTLPSNDERLEDLRRQVCQSAAQISENLGYIADSVTEVW